MTDTLTDHRPAQGWGVNPWGHPTFTLHDALPWTRDKPPTLDGHKVYFIAIHGIGTGKYTQWTYKPIETEDW